MSKKYSINKVNGRNAFEVMSYVANAMKDCKMSRFDINDYQKEARSLIDKLLKEKKNIH